MSALETIQVLHPNGFDVLLINKIDFDPAKHQEPDGPAPKSATPVKNTSKVESKPKTVKPDAKGLREQELEGMHWTAIKALAEELPNPVAEKPEDGWDTLIPEILANEFPEAD